MAWRPQACLQAVQRSGQIMGQLRMVEGRKDSDAGTLWLVFLSANVIRSSWGHHKSTRQYSWPLGKAANTVKSLEKDGWGILRQTLQSLVGSDLVSVLECVRPMLPAFSGYSWGRRKSSLLVSGTGSM